MGEDYNIYCLDDFCFDVLECYIRHGFGNAKIWQTNFFTIDNDEMACMTLAQYYEKVLEARNADNNYSQFIKDISEEPIAEMREIKEGWL